MEEAYQRARAIIEADNEKINQMADLLLEKETIYAEDIVPILGASAQTKDAATESATEDAPATVAAGVTVAD